MDGVTLKTASGVELPPQHRRSRLRSRLFIPRLSPRFDRQQMDDRLASESGWPMGPPARDYSVDPAAESRRQTELRELPQGARLSGCRMPVDLLEAVIESLIEGDQVSGRRPSGQHRRLAFSFRRPWRFSIPRCGESNSAYRRRPDRTARRSNCS